jgi:hypothetical protein
MLEICQRDARSCIEDSVGIKFRCLIFPSLEKLMLRSLESLLHKAWFLVEAHNHANWERRQQLESPQRQILEITIEKLGGF